MKSHKHSRLIHAWAEGLKIERRISKVVWIDCDNPPWLESEEYRLKIESKPDIVDYLAVSNKSDQDLVKLYWVKFDAANLRLIWDGETLELKSAEVIK